MCAWTTGRVVFDRCEKVETCEVSGMKNDLQCEHFTVSLHRVARLAWILDLFGFFGCCILRIFQGHLLNVSLLI